MMHVFLRAAVWIVVLGIGYLAFGPELFDSSRGDNPFHSDANLYLPPPRPERLAELDAARRERALTAEEQAEYQALTREREADFWRREGTRVSDALADVDTGRRAHLAALLAQRGATDDEIGVFFMVLQRDDPGLLRDRD